MFCPDCRDEYRSGFTRCGTCDVALVETLLSEKPVSPAPAVAEMDAEERGRAGAHDGSLAW